MQTVEGVEARSIVASEMVSMMRLKVLPDMLSCYSPDDPIAFHKLCRDFAVQIGLEPRDFVHVFYPFFISMDWDPRHGQFREYMCGMSLRQADWDAMRSDWLTEDFPDIWPPRAAKRQCVDAQTGAVHSREAPSEEERRTAVQQVQQALVEWSATHDGIDYYSWRRWHAARTDPRLRTLLPEQLHPLAKTTPDLNSPVEHAVGTLKHEIREMLLQHDMHDRALWKGPLYFQFIEQAMQKRLLGENGRHHIGGSVRKLPCIAKILAADKGESLVIEHVFGTKPGEPVRAPGPKDRYQVKGTGGEWIRDTRWT